MSPSNSPALSRASGSESDVSQASRGSGSLETSKGKPLVSQNSRNLCLEVADAIVDSLGLSQNSRNLCLEVADAIVDSLGLLVELAVAEELC